MNKSKSKKLRHAKMKNIFKHFLRVNNRVKRIREKDFINAGYPSSIFYSDLYRQSDFNPKIWCQENLACHVVTNSIFGREYQIFFLNEEDKAKFDEKVASLPTTVIFESTPSPYSHTYLGYGRKTVGGTEGIDYSGLIRNREMTNE